MTNTKRAVFIGASAGGVTAILNILKTLPNDYPYPIFVAQHLPKDSQVQMSTLFEKGRESRVYEAEDKMPIERNHIYFAPPDYHLLIESDFTLALSQDELVNFSRPSIDVLFESAALTYNREACGVLLTGSNDDGAKGMMEIQRAGGVTMVQDPDDAEFSFMPKSALNLMEPDFVGSLPNIAKELVNWIEVAR